MQNEIDYLHPVASVFYERKEASIWLLMLKVTKIENNYLIFRSRWNIIAIVIQFACSLIIDYGAEGLCSTQKPARPAGGPALPAKKLKFQIVKPDIPN